VETAAQSRPQSRPRSRKTQLDDRIRRTLQVYYETLKFTAFKIERFSFLHTLHYLPSPSSPYIWISGVHAQLEWCWLAFFPHHLLHLCCTSVNMIPIKTDSGDGLRFQIALTLHNVYFTMSSNSHSSGSHSSNHRSRGLGHSRCTQERVNKKEENVR